MDFQELRLRLKKVGLGEEDLKDGTLKGWATKKIIVGPTRDSKAGRQGAAWKWTNKSAEEAAAVWRLLHPADYQLDEFYSKPSLNTIKRVKFEAQAINKKLRTDAEYCCRGEMFQSGFDLRGVEGVYVKSVDLHRHILTWISTVEKVKRRRSVWRPAIIAYRWNLHAVDVNFPKLKGELKFDGVTFMLSDEDGIRIHCGQILPPEVKKKADLQANALLQADLEKGVMFPWKKV
jgi:hypothetical protein